MAKQRGPVASTFTGKVGNVVGAKLKGGEYVTRAYQPEVKNPNTLRQQVSRGKMAKASQLAAVFSDAVKMGYSAATQSSKMYPRNMFVQDIMPMGKNIIAYNNGEIEVTADNLVFSKAHGITAVPMGEISAAQSGGGYVLGLAGFENIEHRSDESVGVVIVCYDNAAEQVCVLRKIAEAQVNITVAELGGITVDHVKAFFKIVPASGNEIQTDTIPWKYPSATSATGTINKSF